MGCTEAFKKYCLIFSVCMEFCCVFSYEGVWPSPSDTENESFGMSPNFTKDSIRSFCGIGARSSDLPQYLVPGWTGHASLRFSFYFFFFHMCFILMLTAAEWCWLCSQHVHYTITEQVPLGGSRATLHLVRSLSVPWVGRSCSAWMRYGLCGCNMGFFTRVISLERCKMLSKPYIRNFLDTDMGRVSSSFLFPKAVLVLTSNLCLTSLSH